MSRPKPFDPSTITNKQVENATPHIRAAMGHLLQVWDALSRAEAVIGHDISASDISTLAAEFEGSAQIEANVTPAMVADYVINSLE